MNLHPFVMKCVRMIVSHFQTNPPHLPLPKGGLPPHVSRLTPHARALPTVFIAAVLTLIACSRPPDDNKSEPKAAQSPDTVIISAEAQARFGFAEARPQRVTPARFIEATAAIAPDPARVVHIAPIAKGRIERVHVQVGDSVNRGDPLFEYDNIELGEAIGDYRGELAELRKDRAHLEHARRALERGRLLLEKEAVAAKEVHIREAEYGAAEATVENRNARIARIKEKLVRFGMTNEQIEGLATRQEGALPPETSHTIVRASIAGVVIEREGAPGEVVGPEKSLVSIADLSRLWTLIDIYEKDLGQVSHGVPVEISVEAFPGEYFRGTVAHVSDLLDPATRSAKARVEIPNPKRLLKPGMFATVRLKVRPSDAAARVLAIPSGAVQQIGGVPSVFLRHNPTTFERRTVKLGSTIGEMIEVAEGLTEDDKVIAAGSFTLKSELLKEQLSPGE